MAGTRAGCALLFLSNCQTSSACCLSRLPGDTCWFYIARCPTVGLKWTMKLWDSLTTCLILLSAVHASSLLRSRQQSTKRRGRATERPLEPPPVQIRLSVPSPGISRAEADTADWKETLAGGEKCKSLWFVRSPQSAKTISHLHSAGFLRLAFFFLFLK